MSNDPNLTHDYANTIAARIEALATCAQEYRTAWEDAQDDPEDNHAWDAAHDLLTDADLDHLATITGLPDPDDVEDAIGDWWSEGILDVQVLADLANGNRLHEVRMALTLGGPNCWLVWDGIRSWIDCHWGGENSTVSVPSAHDWITTGMQIYADNAGADY